MSNQQQAASGSGTSVEQLWQAFKSSPELQSLIASSGSSSSSPEVYWPGWAKGLPAHTTFDPDLGPRQRVPSTSIDTTDMGSAQTWLRTQFAQQTPEWQKIYQTVSGIAGKPLDPDQVFSAWDSAVQNAAMAYNGGKGAKLTPQGFLDLWAKNAQRASGTTTSHSTSVNYSSAADVAGAYQTQAEQDLGRRASPAEAAAAYARVHGAEAANPSRTTTTTTGSNSSSVSSGGIGSAGLGDLLHQQAMSASDYAEYQAAGPVMAWLERALNAPSQVGT